MSTAGIFPSGGGGEDFDAGDINVDFRVAKRVKSIALVISRTFAFKANFQ